MNLLLADARERPELFRWNGAVDHSALEVFLEMRNIRIPDDLFEFLCFTGGGDFFESETILGPYGDDRLGDSVDAGNAFHRSNGLAQHYFLFRTGIALTAIDQETGSYVELRTTYEPFASFRTFNEWYGDVRSDFAETYGLAPAEPKPA